MQPTKSATTEEIEPEAKPLDSPKQQAERKPSFSTVSLDEINRLYDATDIAGLDLDRDLASPGAFPYTRGIHATGYRGKLWTMRQFAGFGTPEETNERFKYLLREGQNGLSVAYDLPALMGYDADSPLSERSREMQWFRNSPYGSSVRRIPKM